MQDKAELAAGLALGAAFLVALAFAEAGRPGERQHIKIELACRSALLLALRHGRGGDEEAGKQGGDQPHGRAIRHSGA